FPHTFMTEPKTSINRPSSGDTWLMVRVSRLRKSAILVPHLEIAVTAWATTTGVPKPRVNTVSSTQEISLPTRSAMRSRTVSRTNATTSPKREHHDRADPTRRGGGPGEGLLLFLAGFPVGVSGRARPAGGAVLHRVGERHLGFLQVRGDVGPRLRIRLDHRWVTAHGVEHVLERLDVLHQKRRHRGHQPAERVDRR